MAYPELKKKAKDLKDLQVKLRRDTVRWDRLARELSGISTRQYIPIDVTRWPYNRISNPYHQIKGAMARRGLNVTIRKIGNHEYAVFRSAKR